MTAGLRLVGRHEGRWQHCVTCGAAENAHRYRHPFTTLWPARLTPPKHRANPDQGPRCGACRLGLPTHNPSDPLCTAREV